jgi:hypothetical protein
MSSFVSEEQSESVVLKDPLVDSLVSEEKPVVSRDILIVFDIDETLIQFINKGPYPFWKELSLEDRRVIDDRIKYTEIPEKNQVILFRPGLEEFLKMAQDSGRIKVAIWTYSEREYAKMIAEEICRKFDLPEDTFVFAYGTEDIQDHDVPKSLEQIWSDPRFGSKFNKFNTFLVDDRFGNVCHEINNRNSILIQAFAPFGEKKTRQAMTPTLLDKAVNDHMFSDLTEISNKILEDIDGCDDADIEGAFRIESVFAPKCMKRRDLLDYVKKYKGGVELCTIGEVENAADPNKGGRRTKKRRNYKKTTQNKRGNMMKRGKKSMRKNMKNMKSKRYHRR